VDIGKIETHAVDINSRSKGTFMRIQILARTLFFLVSLVAIGCVTHQSGNATSTGNSLSFQPSPTPAQDAVNSVFAVTRQNLRGVFDAAKAIAGRGRTINLGEEQTVDVPAQALRGTEHLKLRIMFLSPLEQARAKGLEFGRGAPPGTPRDRRPAEDAALAEIFEERNQVKFIVSLDEPRDRDASIPNFSYLLLDKNGNRISPTKEPGPLIVPSTTTSIDIEPLIFPVFNDAIPNLTTAMNKMVLIVRVDSDEHRVEFQLR
jgi:hypothetical protein